MAALMDSSSPQTLSEVFQQLGEWRKTRNTEMRVPLYSKWSQFHLSVVHGYLIRLNLSPDSNLLNLAKLFSQEFSDRGPENSDEYDNKAASLMHALQEVFVVPQQHQLFKRDDVVEKNGLVAAFLDLLLRLLHSRRPPGSNKWIDDKINCLWKELRFLLTVLGDESFLSSKPEQVKNLLLEFEEVANKAGALVYLIIFSTQFLKEKLFGDLLRPMDKLKARIIKLLKRQQGIIAEAHSTTRNTAAAVNSLFIIDSLLDDLEDLLSREDDVIADVKDGIETLQKELKLCNSFIKNNSRLSEHSKECVMRIREAACEAEYLINCFLVGDVSSRYFSISLSRVVNKIKYAIESGIQGSEENFEVDVSKFSQLSLQNKSSSSDRVEGVIGLEDKEMEILEYLLGETRSLQLVSICGMPGVGKTTLARELYHHSFNKYIFDKCSWCVVSQRYQMKNVLIDILVNLNDELDMEKLLNSPEEDLKTSIHQYLFGRRYLIVMDDVWSSDVWDDLQACFPDNGNGSRILFTSRNKNVAPSDSIICELPLMSDENCWELLRKKVFEDEQPCPPHLKEIGEKIAKNCRGLPLAVVVVAGILSSMNNEESSWKKVEENLASYVLSGENNMMMQIVELSYDNLEDRLKPCFLYFGVFRHGNKIFVAELLKLWIAEGFVRKEEGERPESVAEKYLMKLIDRSLVTVAKTRVDGGIKACGVHDLLHEFCMTRCQGENLHTLADKNYSINKKHQRLCIHGFESSPRSPLFGQNVRSIFGCFPESGFLNMILLRVLVLQGEVSSGSLNEIKHLINLRCLAIGYGSSSSKVEELKLAFISTLVNLEFLHLKSQFYLVSTPSAMAKMMKLRHIIVNTQVHFGEETSSQQPINNLEHLYKTVIRDSNDEKVLKCSPNLRGLKCKCFPLPAEVTGKFRHPDFGFFTQLESLHLEAGDANAIADISLPPNVRELTLSRFRLSWEMVSEIGRLQNLESLKLLFDTFNGDIWETREGEFKQLRFLTLRSLYDLSEWKVESWDHFPSLRRLMLDDCQHLQEIPAAVGDIATLEVVEIKGYYQSSLVESAKQIEQQQREEGNDGLNFNVHTILGLSSSSTFQTASSSSFFSFLLD